MSDESSQLARGFLDADEGTGRYEYFVLVTSLPHEIRTVAHLYRDRADSENTFDELNNHWGWGGVTTQALKRCRVNASAVALV